MQVTVSYRIVITPADAVDMAEFATTIANRLPDATITQEVDHVIAESTTQVSM